MPAAVPRRARWKRPRPPTRPPCAGTISTPRWGFVEPAYAQAHPLSDLERSRYEQVQISGYREVRVGQDANGDLRREVELRVINRNTQAERLVRSIEIWRWNPEQKRWWLASGLCPTCGRASSLAPARRASRAPAVRQFPPARLTLTP